MSQHPLFQTFVLPLLLALLGMVALRAWPGERWAGCGALLGLLGAMAWLPGFEWPAHSRTLKLPWVVMVGLALALLASARDTGRARPLWTLLSATVVWAGAGLWLADGQASLPLLVGAGLMGGAVLWPLARGRGHAAAPAVPAVPAAFESGLVMLAVLAAAALGLAALAATGGSLLLAQLAGMLASTTLALTGWTWLRPSARWVAATGASWHWPLGLAWLSIAWAWVLAVPAPGNTIRALQVALLALVFLLPALLSRLPAAALAPRWRLSAAALLAALAVVLAGWVGTAGRPLPDTALDPNDPYLTPR